jgi:hypothetical protein
MFKQKAYYRTFCDIIIDSIRYKIIINGDINWQLHVETAEKRMLRQ